MKGVIILVIMSAGGVCALASEPEWTTVESDLALFGDGLEQFKSVYGDFPSTSQGLGALLKIPTDHQLRFLSGPTVPL